MSPAKRPTFADRGDEVFVDVPEQPDHSDPIMRSPLRGVYKMVDWYVDEDHAYAILEGTDRMVPSDLISPTDS